MTKFYLAVHALIKKEDSFLITRRSEINDYKPLTWDIPGGFVEAGESVEIALNREIQEETGISISIEKAVYIYSNLSQIPEKQVFQAIYLCQYIDGEVKLNPDEHDQFKWIKKEEFKTFETIQFLNSFISHEIFNSF